MVFSKALGVVRIRWSNVENSIRRGIFGYYGEWWSVNLIAYKYAQSNKRIFEVLKTLTR